MAQCIDQAPRAIRQASPAGWIGSVRESLVTATDALARYGRRIRERRALDRLDDAMLRDIGISRADVELEVSKPFWRG
jgi:uncharacterized protein YjiS (DUF1127 family)